MTVDSAMMNVSTVAGVKVTVVATRTREEGAIGTVGETNSGTAVGSHVTPRALAAAAAEVQPVPSKHAILTPRAALVLQPLPLAHTVCSCPSSL